MHYFYMISQDGSSSHMDPLNYAFLLLLVFLITVLASIGGVGGSFVIIPLLLFFGYDFIFAATMGLLLNIINTATASRRHLQQEVVDFSVASHLIVGSLVGAPLGAYISEFLPVDTITLIFGITVLLLGLQMIQQRNKESLAPFELSRRVKFVIMVFVGIVIGIMSGLLGIGGGALVLPFLLLMGYPTRVAAGTSAFTVFFASIFGFVSKLALNQPEIDWVVFFGGDLMSILGAYLGSHLMHFKINQSQIKMVIAFLMLSIGVKLLFEQF
jgi:uncharacterized membrane protein YfcA